MKQLSLQQQNAINQIRFLAIEGIQKANSGHPGMPMGFAAPAYQLFTRHLRHSPQNPQWPGRDRFVLSAGHGSMLLYSLLHLCGYDLSMEDLKSFRQWGSKTPGHPEYGHTAGVELTTGPLGQGLATSVGMAIAQKHLAARFATASFNPVDYRVYVISGDGCFEEGITSEASSLAGHLKLGNLTVLYDDNEITIDGSTALSFSESVIQRYEAYGWHCQSLPDAHDLNALDQALAAAHNDPRPSLIKIKTQIGYGSPNKAGTHGIHGSPLGREEIEHTQKALGWTQAPFTLHPEVAAEFKELQARLAGLEAAWNQGFAAYAKAHPDLAAQFKAALAGELPAGLFDGLTWKPGEGVATRVASGKVLNHIMPKAVNFMGGSADLTPSNNTRFTDAVTFNPAQPQGRYLHFGVREHAMGAMLNGISVSGLLRAYGATFLSFADYMLPAIRVAALSGYPSIFVFTHDSIGLGEDGPTHQPVEQVGYLRALPGLTSFRPADATETQEAWAYALRAKGPVALCLTRQNLPVLDRQKLGSAQCVHQGGYVLSDRPSFKAILIATGSEVSLAMEAQAKLDGEGIPVRVVSLPSVELFEAQSPAYIESVIPQAQKNRVVCEAGIRRGWEGYMGDKGKFVGMIGFGASAPAEELYRRFGITADRLIDEVKTLLQA